MNWNQIARAGMTLVAAAACFGVQAAPAGVTISLATEKARLAANEDVVMKVTVTNHSGQNQYLLKSHSPFVDIEEGVFEITRDGAKVPYEGAHYKRPAPTAADYFLLKPGASHTARVELSSAYDMSITGDYAIRYNAKSMHLFGGTEKQMGELQSEAVSLWIDGRYARGSAKAAPAPEPQATAGLSYTRCSATQQSQIVTAINTATSYASNADAYMQGNLGPRYTKWFGTATTARVDTVKANFAAIKDAFLTKNITVNCGCHKNYYAYVYANKPYVIYVCKAFWSAPMTGTDSKGGTLVHEMSHFTVVAGSEDWAYGQSAASSLAISDPNKAVDNADSHEYFGENTPALQ
jgi:peptidyl-Lys metalloendopeptidase